MSENDKPAEGQVPNAMDPAVVQAKLEEIEGQCREHEKALAELRQQAVLLGSDRVEVAVVMMNGRLSVSAPMHDPVTCYGLLEAGKVAIHETRRQQAQAAQAEKMAGGRTPAGLHVPGGVPTPGSPVPPWVKQGKKS